MAQYSKNTNVPALRAEINKEYIIQILRKDKTSRLVGFTRLCLLVGDLHAIHYCQKALKIYAAKKSFNHHSGGFSVVFYRR